MTDHEPHDEATISEGEAERRAGETAELEELLPKAPEGQEQLRAKADEFLAGCAALAEKTKGFVADTDTINGVDDLTNRVQSLRYSLTDSDDYGQQAVNMASRVLEEYAGRLHEYQSSIDQAARPLTEGNEEISIPVGNLVTSEDATKAEEVAVGIRDLIRPLDSALDLAEQNLQETGTQLTAGLRNALGNLPGDHPIYHQLEAVVEEVSTTLSNSFNERQLAGDSIHTIKTQLDSVLSEIVHAKG